jgi:SNF family Na+-dependent transporter
METKNGINPASSRGVRGLKIAFIFAASGSALSLGNMWLFPLNVAKNGGAVFVMTYLVAVFFIGFTIMPAEMTLGRHTQKNPVGVSEAIKPRTPWKLVEFTAIITKVPGGFVFGMIFFFLLLVAALTPTISLLEVPVSYFIDEKNGPARKRRFWLAFLFFSWAFPQPFTKEASRCSPNGDSWEKWTLFSATSCWL